MNRGFSLPPAAETPADMSAYEAERARAQHARIMASMALRLHGRSDPAERGAAPGRPSRTRSAFDPHRW